MRNCGIPTKHMRLLDKRQKTGKGKMQNVGRRCAAAQRVSALLRLRTWVWCVQGRDASLPTETPAEHLTRAHSGSSLPMTNDLSLSRSVPQQCPAHLPLCVSSSHPQRSMHEKTVAAPSVLVSGSWHAADHGPAALCVRVWSGCIATTGPK